MSVSAIRLRNFRGFRDATIELKPLTVLLGANSSGKSSFGHALAAMAHCQWAHGGGQRATLSPGKNDADDWPIDLGSVRDLRTHGVRDRVYIGLQTEAGSLELGFGGLEPFERDLRLSYVSHPYRSDASTFFPASEVVDQRRSKTRKTVIPPFTAQSGVVRVETKKVPTSTDRLVLHRINENEWCDANDIKTGVDLDGLIVRSVQHLGGTSFVLKGKARDELRLLLKNLAYLRATRKRPSRSYRDDEGSRQLIGYAGEWTPTILHQRGKERVTFAEASRIPNTVKEAKSQLDKPWKQRRETLIDGVASWLQKLGLATAIKTFRSPIDKRRLQVRITLLGQRPHDITEVGLGISQIIPVLAAGLMQPLGSLFVVDLPEAHLHPRPQADLADFFCSLALSGRLTLVETHSEMFFHRLRLRAEMDKELANRIAVYFIDPPADGVCRPPRRVRLDFDGELLWPPGFLQEAWEIEAQIAAIREARRINDRSSPRSPVVTRRDA